MDSLEFKNKIKALGSRVYDLKEQILTEEATKNAFIMPFLQILGYDVFNPIEVIPEYVTDVGTKKGEKIDYAIFKDGSPIILIECKHWGQNLNIHDDQLLRYFHVSKAKFGLLTNGITYQFYSDLEEANKMDEKPFLKFNITEIKDNQIEELKKFHKNIFDSQSIMSTASDLKYINEIKRIFQSELLSPTPDFVKFFAKQVYSKAITSNVLEQFTLLTKRSTQQHVNDLITERLNNALTKEGEVSKEQEVDTPISSKEKKVDTTEEELEGFMIVKTILRQKINATRVTYRDAQTYFAILLDDSNRKTICRLYLNGGKKYLALLDRVSKGDSKRSEEVKKEIVSVDDIFNYSDELLSVVDLLDKQ